MNGLKYLILTGLLLVLTGCMATKPNQVKMIESGKQPRVAVFTRGSDQFSIEFIGLTIFHNLHHAYPTAENNTILINQRALQTLSDQKFINLHKLNSADQAHFNKLLASGDGKLSDSVVKEIAAWSGKNGVDYFLVLEKGNMPNIVYNKAGTARGTGLFHQIALPPFLHSVLSAQLVEAASSEVADTEVMGVIQFYDIKHKTFDEKAMAKHREQWEDEQREGGNYTIPESFEEYLEKQSRYEGNDYTTLSADQVASMNRLAIPLVNKNVDVILARLGFANVEHRDWGYYEVLPSTKEELW